MGVLSSFTKNQSHSWAALICSIKSGCPRTLLRNFLRFLCWSQWNLKIGFLISAIPIKYRKIRFSQTLPGWRPWLTCSKIVTFKLLSILFFSKFFQFFVFFKFKGINLSLSPQGWGNCTHFRRHGWVFDEFAGHNDRTNCRFRKKKSEMLDRCLEGGGGMGKTDISLLHGRGDFPESHKLFVFKP